MGLGTARFRGCLVEGAIAPMDSSGSDPRGCRGGALIHPRGVRAAADGCFELLSLQGVGLLLSLFYSLSLYLSVVEGAASTLRCPPHRVKMILDRVRRVGRAALQQHALAALLLVWLGHGGADGVIENLFEAFLRQRGALKISGGSNFLRHTLGLSRGDHVLAST